jgi:signal transduction histidine kinase
MIIDLHFGSIEVFSELNVGTRVIINLPCVIDESASST